MKQAFAPRPNSGNVVLSLEQKSVIDSRVDVFDLHGRRVRSQTMNGNSMVHLNGLPAGIYMLVVDFDNGKIGTSKVLKD